MTTVETIGQRVKRLRLAAGMSQRDLEQPGVSYAYISRIESGTRDPSVKALRKLAAKLGVSADYLESGIMAAVRLEVTPGQIDQAARAWAGEDALTWDELTPAERARAMVGLDEALVDSLAARMYAVKLNREAKGPA